MSDVWQLKIPIRLSLSSSEITSPVDVKPVYLLAPRHAYLPALAQQCLGFFQHVLPSLPGQSIPTPWFEHQGAPLSWNQPIGVLHDLLSPSPAATAAEAATERPPSCSATRSPCLSAPGSPWCLTVHYQNMPAALTKSWQNAGTAKDHYFSSLKEAGYCYRGSDGSGAVMRLPGPAQDDLWSAVNRGDSAAVQAVMNQIRMQPMQKPGGNTCSVPVRIYIRQHKQGGRMAEGLLGLWADIYSSSRPIDVTQPDGHATLLAHVLHMVMPQQFPQLSQQHLQPPPPGTQTPAAAAKSQQQQDQTQGPEHQQQLKVEGVSSSACTGVATVEKSTESSTAAPADPLGALNLVSDGATKATAAATAGGQLAMSTGVADSVATGGAHDLSQRPYAAQAALLDVQPAVLTRGNQVLPHGWPTDVQVYVSGVQPDFCTSLGWLHRNLRAADGFLYIVVHLPSAH